MKRNVKGRELYNSHAFHNTFEVQTAGVSKCRRKSVRVIMGVLYNVKPCCRQMLSTLSGQKAVLSCYFFLNSLQKKT